MPHFIDSHAHLADPAFDPDREDVIRRARDAGAGGIVCIGESLAVAAQAQKIADANRGFVHWTAGIHPHDAASFAPERDLEALEALLRSGASAVGECGLDYHYDNSPREAQREAFVAQLDIAQRLKLPVVVHTRDAEDDTRSLVLAAARRGVVGVLHCYTGSRALATDAVDAGWYVSFSGIVTFRNWTDDQLLRMIPDERLLAESDSPYLAPIPNRGKRNEPAWVSLTVARLAEARSSTPDALGALVAENARRLFALDLSPA